MSGDPVLYLTDTSAWDGWGSNSSDYMFNGNATNVDTGSSGVWSWIEGQFQKGTAALDYMVSDWFRDNVYTEQVSPSAVVPAEQGFSFGSAGGLMPIVLIVGLSYLAYRLSK